MNGMFDHEKLFIFFKMQSQINQNVFQFTVNANLQRNHETNKRPPFNPCCRVKRINSVWSEIVIMDRVNRQIYLS